MTVFVKHPDDYLKPGDRVRILMDYAEVRCGDTGVVELVEHMPGKRGRHFDHLAFVRWDNTPCAEPAAFWWRLVKLNVDAPVVTTHFNGLTPAEAERLAMLAEEAGEIVQAVMKIMRHGWDSYNPHSPELKVSSAGVVSPNNRTELMRELGDLCEVQKLMIKAGDINGAVIAEHAENKQHNMRQFTHHQQGLIPAEVRADEH